MSNITNDKVIEYINKYYKQDDQDLIELRKLAEERHVPIILKETESILKIILKIFEPRKILEIGTALGYSSMFFANSCPDSIIYTIEKDSDFVKEATSNIERFGYKDRIFVIEGDGEDCIKELEKDNVKGFDFVFIDAAKSHYKRFLDSAIKICNDKAIIISDNVLFKAKTVSDEYDLNKKYKTTIRNMREYLDYITSHPRLESCILSDGDGISISMLK